ncbi:MAG: hypothetical protein WCG27_00910 [Pseudomonadota bacterium]
MKKKNKRKIIIAVIIYFAIVIVVPEIISGPHPVYKGKYDSIFNVRVVNYINKEVTERCEIKRTQYSFGDEQLVADEDGYYYFTRLLTNVPAKNDGQLLVSEYHNGELSLKKLECPGKDGTWLSYMDRNDKRAIASLEEMEHPKEKKKTTP